MKVEGTACDRVQEGTGFVAAPGHHRHERARRRGGAAHEGLHTPTAHQLDTDVIAFDSNRDLAVLQVSDLDRGTARTWRGPRRRRRLAVRPPGRRSAARVVDAHRRADRRPRHQHRAHRRHPTRSLRARRRHRTRRLAARPSSTKPARSSASSSPSTSAAPPPPTPSPPPSSTQSSTPSCPPPTTPRHNRPLPLRMRRRRESAPATRVSHPA